MVGMTDGGRDKPQRRELKRGDGDESAPEAGRGLPSSSPGRGCYRPYYGRASPADADRLVGSFISIWINYEVQSGNFCGMESASKACPQVRIDFIE